MIELILPSFLAGLLMFFAPCTLPLLPAYLSFIGGVDVKKDVQTARIKVFRNGVWYVLGFSVVFIIMGSLAGIVGSLVTGVWRVWLMRVGGILVILFGLHMLRIIHIKQLDVERTLLDKGNTAYGPFMLGAAFALGWAPCIGPLLASVLLLASTTTTVVQGMVLLSVFSLGLAVPFLALAWGIGSAYERVAGIQKYMPVISQIGGVFLVILGVLLFFNKLGLFLSFGNGLFIQFY